MNSRRVLSTWHHTSFFCTEHWEVHSSRRDFVFVRVSDTEPDRGTNRVLACPTARTYVYFGRYFCRLDFASHEISEVAELPRLDDPVRQLLRIHADADACRRANLVDSCYWYSLILERCITS